MFGTIKPAVRKNLRNGYAGSRVFLKYLFNQVSSVYCWSRDEVVV